MIDNGARLRNRWLDPMSEEDLIFIKRFLLCSGSLKELASQYGVSYPTIRLRLDRLIHKIQILDEMQTPPDEFESLAGALFAEGRIDEHAFALLLKTHRKTVDGR